ncbi:Uu.00g099670.m01.CDS01 [Anthostomella pinea]|uniref:Uu.00g099670.m01.CDS01 n=1 Tax=Anthostomella pinea TaxID=933095 RepID=A0AAI8VCX7_9PEZI|nr:Uu.00g099670.m01.CDS01 [Anthostomella pinea]
MSSSPSTGLANTPRLVRSRTQSISSDRPSTIGTHGLMTPPLAVSPEAAFIAASAASQIVTNDHDIHSATWYDQFGIEPSGETALVSNSALQLANNFVDQLLYNVIANARSTTLSALRPAVSEVLKPKLAKDAINQADEELREYLGGGEVEDLVRSQSPVSSRDWDLELVWKRTRLRCMVYSSLGDMEEEDEDYYMEQEHLNGETDDILAELVSPAVAIFLTSILEFMGEQVLIVAGQAAFNRQRAKYEKDLKDSARSPGGLSDRIVVEELDMERVALDRTLGRLWRAWKKRIRSPLEPNYSRPFSRSSTSGSGFPHQRRESSAADVLPSLQTSKDAGSNSEAKEDRLEHARERPAQETDGHNVDPSSLELPDSDVEPTYSDEEESEDEEESPRRPKSWIVSPQSSAAESFFLSQVQTRRHRSLPPQKRSRYNAYPVSGDKIDSAEVKATDQMSAGQQRASGSVTIAQGATESVSDIDKESDSSASNYAESKPESDPPSTAGGLLARITTGAVSMGSAAVAGLTAVATGNAPQTEVEDGGKDDVVEDFEEEPEIMTSSRVSIGGRSSPAVSDAGRPSSLIQTRSNSVRSLRVIDVQGPRSPLAQSRSGSDGQDPLLSPVPRSTNVSRESSISGTPPIAEENDSNAPFTRASKRSAIIVPSPTDDNRDATFALTAPPRNRSPPKPTRSPVQAQRPAPAKVTIISNAGMNPQGERPDITQRSLSNVKSPPMPTLPERNTSRPVHGHGYSTSVQRGSSESPEVPRAVQAESPSSLTSSKFKAMRSSEDSTTHRPVDKARNFEDLIQSNETLQYTLTPENMRDMDSAASQQNGSPKPPHRTQKSEDVRHMDRSRSSSIKRSLSVTKTTGLRSHPPTDLGNNGKFPGAAPPEAPVSMPSRGRTGSAAQARDARIPRESMQDFAQFIRSTGPPGGDSSTHGNRANAGSTTVVRNINGPTPAKGSMDSRRTDLSARARLQAREATVNPSNESSELIDFIRRGPPSASSNSPRIPRHVAPFRNTMDSDHMQMTGAVGGKAVDAAIPNLRNSEASTNVTESSAPSSMNSQSALLNKANKAPQYSGGNFDDDDMMPKRTQRRVKDPYAIDFSDEEEDEVEFTPKPKPKPKKEESLIDFLNNYAPPPEPSPQPIVMPKKKSSAPNLIARLRAAGNSSSASNSSTSGRRTSTAAENSVVNSQPRSRPTLAKAYTPIVIPPGAEKLGTDFRSAAAPRVASAGRVPMKKFEPREAVSSTSRTNDLAQFLRDSEPPPTTMANPPPPPEDKSSSGFSRMFERRKKSSAY